MKCFRMMKHKLTRSYPNGLTVADGAGSRAQVADESRMTNSLCQDMPCIPADASLRSKAWKRQKEQSGPRSRLCRATRTTKYSGAINGRNSPRDNTVRSTVRHRRLCHDDNSLRSDAHRRRGNRCVYDIRVHNRDSRADSDAVAGPVATYRRCRRQPCKCRNAPGHSLKPSGTPDTAGNAMAHHRPARLS